MLSFTKPSTHTAQLKMGFSYFQDLIKKHTHSIMGQTWTQSGLSHGMSSTTPPATITSIRTVTPSEQMFSPVTRSPEQVDANMYKLQHKLQ